MLGLGFSAFLVFGTVLVLVGANQADLARDLGLDLARSGLLASALALGIGVGVVGSGPLADRRGRRSLFVTASLVAGLALLLVDTRMGFARACLHVTLMGLGVGAYGTLLNACISQLYGLRAAKPLVLVHSAATLGAVLAPPAIGWIAEQSHWTTSFRASGAGHLALAAAARLVRFPDPPTRRAAEHAPLRSVLSAGILPFAVISFAYIGVESALTIFAVPYASNALQLSAERGLASISAFWLGLLAGRLGLLGVRREIDARLLVAAGLASGVALAAGIGAAFTRVELVFACGGLALAVVFPVMIALAGQRFPEARGSAIGLVAGAGALGGLVIPWLHGALGDRRGVATALATLALWPFVIAVAAWAARRGAAT